MTFSAPSGTRIYAIGDIHGRADLLARLLAQIDADAAGKPKQLIFMGDYIDRGLESRRVIDTLITLWEESGENPIFLLGNHDQVLRTILRDADGDLAADWMRFGGREAALSYGVVPPSKPSPAAMAEFVQQLQLAVPPRHVAFLNALGTHYIAGDYFFCHAGVRPDVPLAEQTEQDMAWIRDDFIYHTAPYEKMIVHGHTISAAPDIHPNRIGIDTGAYATGNLTALALEKDKQWFLHTA